MDKEQFTLKYFSNLKNIDTIVTCLHIHKKNLENELNLNIKAYENILYFVKTKNIKKIIYLSSVNVSEKKTSPYAYVKNKIENLLTNHDNFIIIRPSTIISFDKNKKLYGGRNGNSFNLFEKLFNYNLPIPIIGNGKYLFTFCFLNDLSNFILILIKENFLLNKKINFFSGEYINFKEFIDLIAIIKKKNIIKIYLPLFFVKLLCKLKIFDYKNVDNLINQRIYYDYNNLIKKKIRINQLFEIAKEQ